LLLLALGSGVAYEQWSRWSVARVYPPPGDLVEFDGARSHLYCIGHGSPIVLLEAGLDGNGSFSWRRVQPGIAVSTRVCAYDRAGILWSEPRREPRDAYRIADELHALLAAASEPPPYVMVGHSLGGLLVRVFARRFKGEVVGLVLVDSAHPTQVARMSRVTVPKTPSPPEKPLLVIRLVRKVATRLLAIIGVTRLMAPPVNPPEAYARSSTAAMLAEAREFGEICEQAETGKVGSLPLVVLTAGRRFSLPGMSEEMQNSFHDIRFSLQDDLARLSTNVDHRVSPVAGHYIQLDDPAAVITAVRDVVTAVRARTRVRIVARDPSAGAVMARMASPERSMRTAARQADPAERLAH
jgi:pimeloyl-ACP methyl ester carboxylesterase